MNARAAQRRAQDAPRTPAQSAVILCVGIGRACARGGSPDPDPTRLKVHDNTRSDGVVRLLRGQQGCPYVVTLNAPVNGSIHSDVEPSAGHETEAGVHAEHAALRKPVALPSGEDMSPRFKA